MDEIELVYMNLDEEEEREKMAVEFTLRKYQKGIKYIF